jgi:hypothetical protein
MLWIVVACICCFAMGFITAFWAIGTLVRRAFGGQKNAFKPPRPPKPGGEDERKQQ